MVNAVRRVVWAGIVLIAGLLFSLPTASVYAQGELELGEVVENTLRGKPDRFFFDVAEGQLVVFSAESDEMDMTLTLYDVHYDRLAYDDDGGTGTNALLVYWFETGGTYGIKVNAYGDDDSGHYTLSAMIVEPTMIELDSRQTFDLTMEEPAFAAFESTAGTVINLTALTQTIDAQVELTLYDPQGVVLALDYFYGYDDDFEGNYLNPELRRMFLPSDGLYVIQLVPYFYELETGSVDLTLETTEALWLSVDPYEIELGGDLPWEVFAFEAEADTTYRVIVTCDGEAGINLTLYTGDYMDYYLYGTGGSRIAWDFEPEESGVLRLSVGSDYSDEKDTYTVAVEVVE